MVKHPVILKTQAALSTYMNHGCWFFSIVLLFFHEMPEMPVVSTQIPQAANLGAWMLMSSCWNTCYKIWIFQARLLQLLTSSTFHSVAPLHLYAAHINRRSGWWGLAKALAPSVSLLPAGRGRAKEKQNRTSSDPLGEQPHSSSLPSGENAPKEALSLPPFIPLFLPWPCSAPLCVLWDSSSPLILSSGTQAWLWLMSPCKIYDSDSHLFPRNYSVKFTSVTLSIAFSTGKREVNSKYGYKNINACCIPWWIVQFTSSVLKHHCIIFRLSVINWYCYSKQMGPHWRPAVSVSHQWYCQCYHVSKLRPCFL